MHVAGSEWADARVDFLKKLWADGLSCGQIALRLGTTRNAIMGKVHRLKLPVRSKSSQLAMMRKTKARAAPLRKIHKVHNSGPRLEGVPMPKPSEFDVARKRLIDLEKNDCRFPIGDPTDPTAFGFCALEAIPGKSYCLNHVQRAYSAFQPELKIVESEPAKVLIEA